MPRVPSNFDESQELRRRAALRIVRMSWAIGKIRWWSSHSTLKRVRMFVWTAKKRVRIMFDRHDQFVRQLRGRVY